MCAEYQQYLPVDLLL